MSRWALTAPVAPAGVAVGIALAEAEAEVGGGDDLVGRRLARLVVEGHAVAFLVTYQGTVKGCAAPFRRVSRTNAKMQHAI
jgi:hypothetical protein